MEACLRSVENFVQLERYLIKFPVLNSLLHFQNDFVDPLLLFVRVRVTRTIFNNSLV